jgi:2-dehydropantoate 2-reductase
MRVAVVGTGGVGGYFGGRLAQAGQQVVFIARGEHLRALQSTGLRVESILGDFSINPVQAVEDPAQAGPVEVVLVAVKAWQVSEAAELIKPVVTPETMVIPLGNGVEAPEHLIAALGPEPVLGGLCRISSFIAAPGHIRHTGIEPIVVFGELDRDSQRAVSLQEAFVQAGVNARVSSDIRQEMWEKFLFIVGLSGVGAVTRAPAGIIRTVPESRGLLEQVLSEVISVGQACGISLGAEHRARTLQVIDGLPGETLASMQRDILEGKPSELEYQTGAVVRLGRTHHVPTPANEFLYAALLPQERRARGEVEF